jgi:hypothetical protein
VKHTPMMIQTVRWLTNFMVAPVSVFFPTQGKLFR